MPKAHLEFPGVDLEQLCRQERRVATPCNLIAGLLTCLRKALTGWRCRQEFPSSVCAFGHSNLTWHTISTHMYRTSSIMASALPRARVKTRQTQQPISTPQYASKEICYQLHHSGTRTPIKLAMKEQFEEIEGSSGVAPRPRFPPRAARAVLAVSQFSIRFPELLQGNFRTTGR